MNPPARAEPPSGHVDPYLTPEEQQKLRATGRDPDEYAALVQVVQDRGVGVANIPGMGKAVVMQITVVIPYAALPLRLSGLMDAQGQQMAGRELLDQIPGQPIIRMLVKKTALGADLRAMLDYAVATQARQTTIDGLPGRPPDGSAHEDRGPGGGGHEEGA